MFYLLLVETDHPLGSASESDGSGVLTLCGIKEALLRKCFREAAGADGKQLSLLVAELPDRAVSRIVEEIVERVILIADDILWRETWRLVLLQDTDLPASIRELSFRTKISAGLSCSIF